MDLACVAAHKFGDGAAVALTGGELLRQGAVALTVYVAVGAVGETGDGHTIGIGEVGHREGKLDFGAGFGHSHWVGGLDEPEL